MVTYKNLFRSREQFEKSSVRQPKDCSNQMICSNNESRLQVDLINIEGCSGKALKILIECLLGDNYLLARLYDLKIYADMLMICHSYDLKTCIIKVIKELVYVPVNKDNLIDALNLLKVIQEVEEYQHVYDKLYTNCLIVGQQSFLSKQFLIDFVLKNKVQKENIFSLLSDNYSKQKESIR